MPTVGLIELCERGLKAGLVGNYRVQVETKHDTDLWDENCGLWDDKKVSTFVSTLHFLCIDTLDQLLVTATKTQIVIIEPPFFPYLIKQWLAQILLEDIRVLSLAFLPLSVCTVVGAGKKHGLVGLKLHGQACFVPVYEYRELTPHIGVASINEADVDDDEMPIETLSEKSIRQLTYDVRKSMQIINVDLLAADRVPPNTAFLGGHIIVENSTVRNVLSRKKNLNREQEVYDSLFA